MRNLAIAFAVLLGMSVIPQSASADTVEYNVTTNVFWTCGSINAHVPFGDPCTSGGAGRIFGQFSSSFAVYANGSLVPGSMDFLASGTTPPFAAAYTFDTTPPTYPGAFSSEPPITLDAPFNWSTASSDTFSFVPPGCAYFAPGPATNCLSAAWPPTGSETLPASTIILNCFDGFFCDGQQLFSCYSSSCAAGFDNPAAGGSVIVTEFVAPEPSSLLFLVLGFIPLFAFQIWRCHGRLRLGSGSSI